MMRRKTQVLDSQKLRTLEEKDNKKTEFFLAASHQLKSPLAIIQWCLQSVLESSDLSSADRALVIKALGQANAMSHLITDMLHVFRLVNRQGKPYNYTAVNLNKLIDQSVEQCMDMAKRQGVHLQKGPLEVLPLVYADESFLKQALINLLDNAIKYSKEKGKVTVTAKLGTDKRVAIQVADEGIGIGEADQLNLFKEFYRTEEARAMTHDGTGLGLVLVKHIIEECGGSISLQSQLHKGSVFTVYLPVRS